MMRIAKLQLASLALLGTFAACASGPSGPPPLDPTGTYAYTADAQGMAVTGTMTIMEDGDGYSGRITSSLFPPIPISTVDVVDQTMTISAAGPEGTLSVEMLMSGNAFKGTWSMAGMGGEFSGTKEAN